MIESKKRWTIHRPDSEIVQNLESKLQIPALHAKILASRGIETVEEAEHFLHMDESSMHDPFLLYEMDKAVSLIQQAIQEGKKIAVYGDYDADGVTSTTVLTTALERLSADVIFTIPNRFDHGYGPNSELFELMHDEGVDVIITVDNGISGHDPIAHAKSLGMTVIVTDHHEIGETLPIADAVIHPRHPQGSYPFGELAGVGVAFKLAWALLGNIPKDLLEFAAIGTVADLVPLQDENRYFVKEGIRQIRTTSRPAIKAICRTAAVEQAALDEESIGFVIGPRLNAAGRLGDADPAVELLKSTDSDQAMALAKGLDELNKERQAIVKEITAQADETVTTMYGDNIPYVLIVAGEDWNPGVVGIVASRLTEKYHRPTIILCIDPETGMAKGSARSIAGFDLFAELSKNAHLLPHFGGHQMAAGMTLAVEDIEELRSNLNEQGAAVLTEELLVPEIQIDVPLTLDEISVDVLESMDLLRPFGMSFAKPVYVIEHTAASSIKKIGAGKDHLKLELKDQSRTLDAIGFRFGYMANQLTPNIELSVAGDLQVNEWNGFKKPQLLISDIKSDAWQLFDLRGLREPSRWLADIPTDSTMLLSFQAHLLPHFQSVAGGRNIHQFGKDTLTPMKNLVLLDMPNESEDLIEVVKLVGADRIYVHLYEPESKYFDGLPARDQFGWFYTFLKKRGQFDSTKNADLLAKHMGWKKESVKFMLSVFSELKFVKIENGVAAILETEAKKDLAEAPSYQKRQRQIELEKILLYASYTELKQWFEAIRN